MLYKPCLPVNHPKDVERSASKSTIQQLANRGYHISHLFLNEDYLPTTSLQHVHRVLNLSAKFQLCLFILKTAKFATLMKNYPSYAQPQDAPITIVKPSMTCLTHGVLNLPRKFQSAMDLENCVNALRQTETDKRSSQICFTQKCYSYRGSRNTENLNFSILLLLLLLLLLSSSKKYRRHVVVRRFESLVFSAALLPVAAKLHSVRLLIVCKSTRILTQTYIIILTRFADPILDNSVVPPSRMFWTTSDYCSCVIVRSEKKTQSGVNI